MSTNLYYRPMPRGDQCLGYRLKFVLAPYLWDHDGSLGTEWTTVGSELIPFLKGVIASADEEVRKEAQELLDLIKELDEVQISLQG